MERATLVCRICERSVPASFLLAHTEQCGVVQSCADVVQRSNDKLARLVTDVQVRVRHMTSTSSPSSSTSSSSTPVGPKAGTTVRSVSSPMLLPPAPEPFDRRSPSPQPIAQPTPMPVAERHLTALAGYAQQALEFDREEDLAAVVRRICDAAQALESSPEMGSMLPADQEELHKGVASVIQAARAKEDALTNIRRCLQQRPDLALTTDYVGLPRLDDFVVQRTLSRGAFGEVLLARKRSTQDYYAIKVMHKRDLVRKNQITYVLRERLLMASMDSPYVIKLFYSFQTVDSLYMVLEYANGGDVSKLLRNYNNTLSESWARFYAADIVQALDHIHQLGIVHRDIKPDNLLISANGHIKLADFGLSQGGMDRAHVMPPVDPAAQASRLVAAADTAMATTTASASTITEAQRQQLMQLHSTDRRRLFSMVGTEDYMAPEVIRGAGHDTAIDWWSFGVCLYEFIAGFPPFWDQNPQVIVRNILNGALLFPENMSPLAKDLIVRLLHTPHIPFIARGSEEDLHDESTRMSLAAMTISTTEDGSAEMPRPQENLLENLEQFQFKNVALLADVNRALAGAALPANRAALPTVSLLEDQMLVAVPAPQRLDLPDNRPIDCLVAEDNPVTQQVIRGLMQQMGARITQAFTGTETVRYADERQFDLIFMDIMMPEMDGRMATTQIRTRIESRNRDTPIIAFTALNDWNDNEYGQIGMNDLLAKPFTRAELFAVFTRWLHKRV